MLTSEFDYPLPPELIAQKPLARRDASRMMVVFRQEGRVLHSRFEGLADFLEAGSVMVLNDSKVIPAKAWGEKSGRKVEFLFLGEKKKGLWEVLCRPAKHVRQGDRILFAPGFVGEVADLGPRGRRILQFCGADVRQKLREIGYAPLPPYIKRGQGGLDLRQYDLERYQTVFARREGSIAAPTAGLHFTRPILKGLRESGVLICPVTLEVGLATFQPVEAERLEDHPMLAERYAISPRSAHSINQAKKDKKKVTAVGTTVVRALESAWTGSRLAAGRRATDLFIFPGFQFKAVDRLLTNFHLPRSTLLMLVSAFAGTELIKKAYAEAVRQKYRFYSYGDCMLII
jgi:S-adenosylmethionine:tRNA ribosyltransferase-isomerase